MQDLYGSLPVIFLIGGVVGMSGVDDVLRQVVCIGAIARAPKLQGVPRKGSVMENLTARAIALAGPAGALFFHTTSVC